jgi:hypothetical protein
MEESLSSYLQIRMGVYSALRLVSDLSTPLGISVLGQYRVLVIYHEPALVVPPSTINRSILGIFVLAVQNSDVG